MNILLVCAGGFSTSILMKKVRTWSDANGRDVTINASGKEAYKEIWKDYDCILLGPQISYGLDEIKANVTIPVATIEPMDYAIGNAENVVKLAEKIIAEKGE